MDMGEINAIGLSFLSLSIRHSLVYLGRSSIQVSICRSPVVEYNEAPIHREGQEKASPRKKTSFFKKIFEIFYSFQSKRLVLENGWSAILVSVIF